MPGLNRAVILVKHLQTYSSPDNIWNLILFRIFDAGKIVLFLSKTKHPQRNILDELSEVEDAVEEARKEREEEAIKYKSYTVSWETLKARK